MTTTVERATGPRLDRGDAGSSRPGGMRRAGRAVTVAILIVALLLSGVTRYFADRMRGSGDVVRTEGAGSSLSAMNSFALALLLGGLRGPLVMFLWTSSESQKTENNLEDFDTKVEWIRLLQPEFDTVHIFQIWNKAYNISVKMTSLSNKYTTILDALEYAQRVDRERPDDINIVAAIAGIYFDKLAGSQEKGYYIRRVRNETLPHESHERVRRDDPGWRRTELDPVLDANYHVLPQYLQPRGRIIGDANNPLEHYDGSELQFLKPFEPYPYGVPPHALAYNYFKRAQMLQSYGKQRHAQLSELVVDSRPALALKGWAENVWESGRRAELQAFGKTIAPGAERLSFETAAAAFPLAQPIVDRKAYDEAVFTYERAVILAHAADAEYARHLNNPKFLTNASLYASHREGLKALAELNAGDRDYLKAMTAASEQKAALLKSAADSYRAANNTNGVIILRYYVPDELASQVFPPGVTRQNIDTTLPPDQIGPLLQKSLDVLMRTTAGQAAKEDIDEYRHYIDRATTRLNLINQHQ